MTDFVSITAAEFQKLKQLADKAIAHVRARYTKEQMCAATLQVYEEVLAEARGGARGGCLRSTTQVTR